MNGCKRPYRTPRIEEWTVAGLTQVGHTNPGDDTWPGNADKSGGSKCPPSGIGGC
jgi:hypothetical protein